MRLIIEQIFLLLNHFRLPEPSTWHLAQKRSTHDYEYNQLWVLTCTQA